MIPAGQRAHINEMKASGIQAAHAATRRKAYIAKVLTVARKWAEEGQHFRVIAERLQCDPAWILKKLAAP